MPQIFAQKTNHAFFQTVFTVVAALAAMAFISFKVFQASSLYLEVLIHKIKDACGCTSMTQFFAMHPDVFRAIILFGIGISVFAVYSLYKLFKLNSQTKKYIAHYLSFARARHSAKLKAVIKSLGLEEEDIVEINNSASAVFCFGFLRPKICISHELVNMLGLDELRAVLTHEAGHMTSYEPLKIFIIKYCRSIFFFLPGIKSAAKKYMLFSELAADEKASGSATERSSLAGAILKISEREECRMKRGASLSYFSSAAEERANRLSDEAYIPKFKFLDKGLIIGSLVLAIISLGFIFVFSSSTKAFEMHNIAGCVSKNNLKNDLICNLANRQNINNEGNVYNTLSTDDFQQKSACQAD